jgi:hypothetical protein
MRLLILGIFASLAAAPAMAQQAVNAELIRLHDELHLSTAQEMAWHDYTHAIAANPQAEARHRAADQLMPMVPAPRRIALMEAAMASDLADFRREGAAVVAFYNQLTPEQQRTFDRDTLPSANGAPGRAPPR